jgi:hypothetical protein
VVTEKTWTVKRGGRIRSSDQTPTTTSRRCDTTHDKLLEFHDQPDSTREDFSTKHSTDTVYACNDSRADV